MNGVTVIKYVFDTCAATFFIKKIKKDRRMLGIEESLNSGRRYADIIGWNLGPNRICP